MHSKILLIEQQAGLRTQLEAILKEHGYEVIPFDQPQKALDWLSIAKAELIILEKALSGEDAVTFCRKIRGFKESQHTPIIVLLTLEEMRERGDLKAGGASDFLVKPFTPPEVVEKVELYILEKAAKIGTQQSSKKSNPNKGEEGLENIFGSGEAIDLDSILKESQPVEERKAASAESVKPSADDGELELEKIGTDTPFPFDIERAPEYRPEDQHDYSWFMDEMKDEKEPPKKKESKAPAKEPAPEASLNPAPPPIEKPKDKFQTEEMGTSKLNYAEFLKEITGESEKPAEEPKSKEPELNPQVTMDSKGEFKPKKTTPPPPEKVQELDKKPTTSPVGGLQEPHSIPGIPSPEAHIPEPQKMPPPPAVEKSAEPQKAGPKVDYQKLYTDLTDKLASKLAKELVANLDAEKILKLIKQELEKK